MNAVPDPATLQPDGHIIADATLFRRLAEQALDTVLIFSLSRSRMIYCNRPNFLGYSEAELRAPQSLTPFVHPDDFEQLRCHFQEVCSGVPSTTEYRVRHKAGHWEWVASRATPLSQQPDGQTDLAAFTFTLVTDRKLAEARLLEIEARYHAVVEQSTEAIFVLDAQTRRVLEANAAWRKLLGYTPEEVTQLTLYDVVAHDRESIDANFERIMAEAAVALGERRYRRRDGSEIPVMVNASRVWHGGQLSVIVVARDLTEQKRREEELALQAAELAALYRASARLLTTEAGVAGLAEQMVNAMIQEFAFADCGLMLVDEAAGELKRVARAGPYQVTTTAPLLLDGPGLTTAAVRLRQTIYAPDVSADERYFPGEARTRSELAVPLQAGGRVIGVLDLQSDRLDAFDERARRIIAAFAERAELALANALLLERLNEARRVAEEANRVKSEFLANTSHELRTPLTGILGSLSLILNDDARTLEEAKQFVQIAYDSGRHLLNIVNDLLDIAKIEAGKMNVRSETVNLSELFAEVYMLMRPAASKKGLALNMPSPEEATLMVRADPERLRQIITNLLGNALKFTDEGAVTVRARRDADQPVVVIDISDTGIGIPPDKQDMLFRPFVQVDGTTTRKHGGTGLGLSISRRLAELMGGSLTLYSAGLGQGSTFTLRLPLAEPAPAGREGSA